MYLRAKWTEIAGNLFEHGQRPRFEDFLKFVKERAKLVNNEFGRDLSSTFAKPKLNGKDLGSNADKSSRAKYASFAANEVYQRIQVPPLNQRTCEVCSGHHRIWKCDRFKGFDFKTKRNIVLQNGLCNRCLERGHIARTCPKTHFRCQEAQCGEPHHTLMQLHDKEKDSSSKQQVKTMKSIHTQTGTGRSQEATERQNTPSNSVATTHTGGNKVCLGAVPVKVRGINGSQEIYMYALLDNGSEVTLCDEKLAKKLNIDGEASNFTVKHRN